MSLVGFQDMPKEDAWTFTQVTRERQTIRHAYLILSWTLGRKDTSMNGQIFIFVQLKPLEFYFLPNVYQRPFLST
jgi:hypothetical protein